jgi:hypothetical protein
MDMWMRASTEPLLHGLRNSHGPSWLKGYALPAVPDAPPG